MMGDRDRASEFVEETNRASDEILNNIAKGKRILLISHLDADGISAAGILAKALLRAGAIFSVRIERWMEERVAEEVSLYAEENVLPIFIDMGSGYLDILGAKLEKKCIVILDHHQPIGRPRENFFHVNPHLFGVDGAKSISSAGISYLVAKSMDKNNVDLAYLAVVGALGDLQDKYEEKRLGGLNDIIVKDSIEAGFLSVEKDLLLFGRETRPIHKALSYLTNPYIPGISGEEDKCLAFLSSLNIELKKNERWRALRDLSQEEKRKLFSALHDYLISKGFKSDIAMSLIGTVYTIIREEPWTPLRDAREFALLLNATGRMGMPSLGVAVCMGDRKKAYNESLRILDEYRQMVSRYLAWLNENPDRIEEWEYVYVLHGEKDVDEKTISTISTIISTNLPNPNKPIIAYSYMAKEKATKISARATDSLVKMGINLGEIIRIAAEKCSGIGGGHDIAAGAQIPYEQKMQFLKYVNLLVKECLMGKKNGG
ncbi:MAG: DHH family phosphoesterase [Candidatus Bathyarchaeia archaeon]